MINKIIVISGVTASGKSDLAISLTQKFMGTVINADSMQIYKGLPILSAQPSKNDLLLAEHKLYDFLSPYNSNSVFEWITLVRDEIKKAFLSDRIPIVVGGTGMYITRLINGIRDAPSTDENLRAELSKLYDEIGWNGFLELVIKVDPEAVQKIKKNDKQRLIRTYEIYKISGKKASELENEENTSFFERNNIFHINILPERDVIYNRCEERFRKILDDAIEEVKIFMKNYPDILDGYHSIKNTIGLVQINKYLNNETNYKEMFESSVRETRHYAKRQYTWFRNQFKYVDFLFDKVPNMMNINNLLKKIGQFL